MKVWGLVNIDVSELGGVDRGEIARIIARSVGGRVMLAYDVSDDIFRLYPDPAKLTNDELGELLGSLGIKYNGETGEIEEVPEHLVVAEIFDGLGTTTLVLRRRK